MEEQFKVYIKEPQVLLMSMSYLCEYNIKSYRHYSCSTDCRDYILKFDLYTNVASFMTYLGKDWYKYNLNIDYANIIRKMYLPRISKKLIHPLHMRVGGLYEIHDIRNTGTINRGIYRLKDINDCVYYFSRIKGDKTIFQHDLLSEDKQMCKDRLFFEVHINKEVIDEW